MRNLISIATGTLCLAFLATSGCSKKSTAGPTPVNLGTVELVPGQSTYFTLAPHESCALTAETVSNNLVVTVDIVATNEDHSITHDECRVITIAGHSAVVAMNSQAVAFTPVLKK